MTAILMLHVMMNMEALCVPVMMALKEMEPLV